MQPHYERLGPNDFAAHSAIGADESKVRELIDNTFYNENNNPDHIFEQYRPGNKEATLIGQYRKQNVVKFAQRLIAAVAKANIDLIITAAMMPEGAIEVTDFSVLHYGQSYEDATTLYDDILLMVNSQTYGEYASCVAQIVSQPAQLGTKVVAGLQAFFPTTSSTLMA